MFPARRRSVVASLENFPIQWAGPLAVVTLPREIDIFNADEIKDTLLAILNGDVTTLVVDMTGTTFCGCAGASAVARAHQHATANRAQVRVASRAPGVRRVFAITGVDRLISLFDSVDAAVAGAAGAQPDGAQPDGASHAQMGVGADLLRSRWPRPPAQRHGA
jgi:anti-sigma B factor antagonist